MNAGAFVYSGRRHRLGGPARVLRKDVGGFAPYGNDAMPTASALLDRKGREIATIEPDRSVREAAEAMNERRIGSLVVVEEGAIVGILSERDILTRVVAMGRDPDATTVRVVMTHETIVGMGQTTLDELRHVMRQKRIRHVPIVEDGELTGMISIGDLNAETREALTATITTLESYIRQG